jgi:AcrR family transcriptional regulator
MGRAKPVVRVSDAVKAERVARNRGLILEAATRLFVRYGFHGVSMDALAEALGVTKPFIYYQFRDKSEILLAISGRGADLSLSAAGDAEAMEGSHAAKLEFFCRRLAEIVIRHGDYLAVYIREVSNLSSEGRRAILRVRNEVDQRIAALVLAGVEAGEFDVVDPLIAARAVTGMISFMYMWHRDYSAREGLDLATVMAGIALRTLIPSAPDRRPQNRGRKPASSRRS